MEILWDGGEREKSGKEEREIKGEREGRRRGCLSREREMQGMGQKAGKRREDTGEEMLRRFFQTPCG